MMKAIAIDEMVTPIMGDRPRTAHGATMRLRGRRVDLVSVQVCVLIACALGGAGALERPPGRAPVATRMLSRRLALVGVHALVSATGVARADVIADLLPPCERTACVSSQDDRPAVWDNPWEYDERRGNGSAGVVKRLRGALANEPGCELVAGEPMDASTRYLRAVCNVTRDGGVRDDLEFYLTPGDSLVQFRAERSPAGVPDLGANRRRIDRLRESLRLTKLPVLRDRRTVLWFESPLDSFGQAEYDSMQPLGR
jgi:uncharacterized protein (DUF1499 family)